MYYKFRQIIFCILLSLSFNGNVFADVAVGEACTITNNGSYCVDGSWCFDAGGGIGHKCKACPSTHNAGSVSPRTAQTNCYKDCT
jgi:hypothetical protein